jgi:methionine-rich copper-binding protein CopC
MSRWLSGVAAAALVLASAAPASAHALLRKAIPGVGSTVHTPPTEIRIIYSEGVEPSLSSIVVRDAAGAEVDSGGARTAPDNQKELIVGLKTLAAGTYTVEWHVTSVDTHKTDGRFSFSVAP